MFDLSIAIGDLHSHFPALELLLDGLQSQYGIFESELVLRQNIELTFTGDAIDRGKQGIPVLEMLMRLDENENFTAMFGNHELIALGGLDRARFAIREFAHRPFDCYGACVHGYNGGFEFVREFDATELDAMKGFLERMKRGGDLGDWIRSMQPFHMTEIHGKKVLYIHGGLPQHLTSPRRLEDYLQTFQSYVGTPTDRGKSTIKYLRDPMVDDGSPFWDRRISHMNQSSEVAELADSVEVDFIVIGHTPQRDGQIANYFNRVFNIDVGMCPTYGGNNPTAIVFKEDGVYSFSVSNETKNTHERLMLGFN